MVKPIEQEEDFEVTPEADAAEEAAIEALLNGDPPPAARDLDTEEDGVVEEPARSGKKAAAAADDEDEDEDDEQGPAAGKARDDEEQDDLDLDEEFGTAAEDAPLARAVKALELDGWDADLLKSVPRETVLKMGEKRAAEHAKLDRLIASKSKADAGTRRAAEDSQEEDDEAVLELAAEFGGDERAKERARKIVKNLREPIARQAGETAQRFQFLEAQAARGQLVDRFPRLADSREFQQTLADAKRLHAKGEAKTIAGAMQKAAKLRYADELLGAARERDRKVSNAKRAGVGVVGGQRGSEKELDRDALETRFLERRLAGDTAGAEEYARKLGI